MVVLTDVEDLATKVKGEALVLFAVHDPSTADPAGLAQAGHIPVSLTAQEHVRVAQETTH